MNSRGIYRKRASGKQHGDVFTDPVVVEYMLDLVGYRADRDLSHLRVLEPSCGDGVFLMAIISRLLESSQRFGFNFEEVFQANVFAYDIDAEKLQYCSRRIYERWKIRIAVGKNFVVGDFLLSTCPNVDIVVGNPPYIRYEEIPKEWISTYRERFSTFYYRADMYVLFYEKSLQLLESRGKLCFISSNRWLRNTYGKELRKLISQRYSLEVVLDMESVQAFQEPVLAYPAITLISQNPTNEWTSYGQIYSLEEISCIKFVHIHPPKGHNWDELFLSRKLASLYGIEEQGFRIGIGVATGRDALYVSSKFKGVIEDSLLLPCINARNLKGDEFSWDERYLLTPYNEEGELIDLNHYPHAKKYLESHFGELSVRAKARKNPEQWYATIDKIDRKLVKCPKILLPDISANRFIFLDEGRFYPQHNLYYILGNGITRLKILAALLMSSPIREQLSLVANRMNGGFTRWQSQYLKKLRIPLIDNIPCEQVKELLMRYDERDYLGIDDLVTQIIDRDLEIGRGENKDSAKEGHWFVGEQAYTFF